LYYLTYFFLLIQKTHWVGLFLKPGFLLARLLQLLIIMTVCHVAGRGVKCGMWQLKNVVMRSHRLTATAS